MLPRAKPKTAIEVWPGVTPGQPDPSTHFWYKAADSWYRRICDGADWPSDTPLLSDTSRIYVPCVDCRGLYVEDIVRGGHLLAPIAHPRDTLKIEVGTRRIGVLSPNYEVSAMAKMVLGTVPIATFARFYDANGPQQVKIVRDSRLYQSDPKGYAGRDFYLDFRNALKQTHFATNDIGTFAAALDGLVKRQRNPTRKEHFRKLGKAYIKSWPKNAEFFELPQETVSLADLKIGVGLEVGMRDSGDEFALKLQLRAARPTRVFRQAIQQLSAEALAPHPQFHTAIWDIRREMILPPPPIPKDLALALESQAVAFRQIWESLDSEEAA